MCHDMLIWNQESRSAMQPAPLKFYLHQHAVLKCVNGTDVIVKGTWHADLTVPSCALEYLYAGSNSACKRSRSLTPIPIFAVTKPNNM